MKYRFLLVAAVAVVGLCRVASGDEQAAKTTQVSLIIRGAHCAADVKAIRTGLQTVPELKFAPETVQQGDKRRYFTPPFQVTLKDLTKSDIGAVAEYLSKAKIPHRDDVPVKVNLILFTPDQIDEPSVMALRAALRDVNGVEVDLPGGLGGVPNKGYYWVQLEDAGGAALSEILAAAKKSRLKLATKSPE